MARAWRTDLLECPISALSVDGDHLRLELSPFEIATVRLEVPRA